MKKFKRNDLRLEKEVISALTGNEMESVKGGIDGPSKSCGCPPVAPMTQPCGNVTIFCPTQNINCVKPITGIGCSVSNCNSDIFKPISNPCQPNVYRPVE